MHFRLSAEPVDCGTVAAVAANHRHAADIQPGMGRNGALRNRQIDRRTHSAKSQIDRAVYATAPEHLPRGNGLREALRRHRQSKSDLLHRLAHTLRNR